MRITNPSATPNRVRIEAWDNDEPAEETVTLELDAQASVQLSVVDLEEGNPERFDGRFGDGTGK